MITRCSSYFVVPLPHRMEGQNQPKNVQFYDFEEQPNSKEDDIGTMDEYISQELFSLIRIINKNPQCQIFC